jgi:hypothetical protein
MNVKILKGAHLALNYRGRAIKRSKIWLQKHFDTGYIKYGYTGWQWMVAFAQKRMEEFPIVNSMCDKLNVHMDESMQFNHCIGTMYEDGQDNIGFHSDKVKNWVKNSPFIAIKFGEARHFSFSSVDGDVFFNEKLAAGTAVIVGYDANQETKHAVPIEEIVGQSGSLVFRSLETCVPWEKVLRQKERSDEVRIKSRVRKLERNVHQLLNL